MALRPMYGHEALVKRLGTAVAAGRIPQSLLFEGPRGVGKQRLALWLAQTLFCEQRTDAGVPCGLCPPCKQVQSLTHPDLHWFVPVEITRKGADADKQVDLVEEALGEEMAARREQPLYRAPAGMASHGIAAVRLLLRSLLLTPAMAQRKVFIIGDAERLLVQRGNPEAANALLKALEEPPADTVFVLTSAEPDALLPTILSRVVRVRLARLRPDVVAQFAATELGLAKARQTTLAAAADGSIGRLIELAADTESGNGEAAQAFVEAGRKGAAERYARALAQTPFQARGGFTELLDGLLAQLRSEARAGKETAAVVEAIARVLEARDMAQGNVNPQLLTAVLAEDLWSAR